MEFNESKMQFTGLYNGYFGEYEGSLTVNLDDDLVPVSVEYDQRIPVAGAHISIDVVDNGYVVSNDNETNVVSGHNSYSLSSMVEKMAYRIEHVTVPFNPEQWEENFTDLASQQLSQIDHAQAIANEGA